MDAPIDLTIKPRVAAAAAAALESLVGQQFLGLQAGHAQSLHKQLMAAAAAAAAAASAHEDQPMAAQFSASPVARLHAAATAIGASHRHSSKLGPTSSPPGAPNASAGAKLTTATPTTATTPGHSPQFKKIRKRTMLPCEHCGKEFDRPSLLTRHLRTHTGEKPHICDICSKGFSTSSSLNTHRRIHTGDKPHRCNICNKCFTASSNLYYHRMTHNKEKPHKCALCSKSFPTPGDLKSHMYVHDGSWPYKCHICDRGFSKPTNLKNHMYIHTGDKPHKCSICDKHFALACNLRAHIRTHHETNASQSNNNSSNAMSVTTPTSPNSRQPNLMSAASSAKELEVRRYVPAPVASANTTVAPHSDRSSSGGGRLDDCLDDTRAAIDSEEERDREHDDDDDEDAADDEDIEIDMDERHESDGGREQDTKRTEETEEEDDEDDDDDDDERSRTHSRSLADHYDPTADDVISKTDHRPHTTSILSPSQVPDIANAASLTDPSNAPPGGAARADDNAILCYYYYNVLFRNFL